MALASLPCRGASPVVPSRPIDPLPPNASATDHVRWCRRFARYCVAEARSARLLGLPERDWLRACRFARLALLQWRVRARLENTP